MLVNMKKSQALRARLFQRPPPGRGPVARRSTRRRGRRGRGTRGTAAACGGSAPPRPAWRTGTAVAAGRTARGAGWTPGRRAQGGGGLVGGGPHRDGGQRDREALRQHMYYFGILPAAFQPPSPSYPVTPNSEPPIRMHGDDDTRAQTRQTCAEYDKTDDATTKPCKPTRTPTHPQVHHPLVGATPGHGGCGGPRVAVVQPRRGIAGRGGGGGRGLRRGAALSGPVGGSGGSAGDGGGGGRGSGGGPRGGVRGPGRSVRRRAQRPPGTGRFSVKHGGGAGAGTTIELHLAVRPALVAVAVSRLPRKTQLPCGVLMPPPNTPHHTKVDVDVWDPEKIGWIDPPTFSKKIDKLV